MSRSLPSALASNVSAPAAAAPTPRVRRTAREVAVNAATRVVLAAMPRIPTAVKRLLAGGRSVTIDGNTLDTTLQLMLASQRAAGIDGLVIKEDAQATRAYVGETTALLAVPEVHVAVADLSIPGPAGAIPARHYRPASDDPAPLLVFYHGGGFVFGDLDSHDALCRLTCRDAAVHVLSIDYRLAPEHKAPAAVDDAYAGYRWALENGAELGALPGDVAVGGDSAGGNLAAVVAQLARNDGVTIPTLQWLIYPIADQGAQTRSRTLFSERFLLTKANMDWFAVQYLHGSSIEPTDPRVSPLLAEDLSCLPPALVVTAGFDPLRDEGEQYAQALRSAGVTVDLRRMGSLTHAFANFFPLGGGSASATAEMISALRAHLSHG